MTHCENVYFAATIIRGYRLKEYLTCDGLQIYFKHNLSKPLNLYTSTWIRLSLNNGRKTRSTR